MSEALIAIQRDDGFWNPSLVDPDHFGGKETSGTAFFVFGLAWGINNEFLDSAAYMPYVIAGWEGMVQGALHDNGFLGWVQSFRHFLKISNIFFAVRFIFRNYTKYSCKCCIDPSVAPRPIHILSIRCCYRRIEISISPPKMIIRIVESIITMLVFCVTI
ncbi:hypothetical protein ES708_14456 [subsurface metagenome]